MNDKQRNFRQLCVSIIDDEAIILTIIDDKFGFFIAIVTFELIILKC